MKFSRDNLKKILIDIHDSSHLNEKSIRGKIDMELAQFLSGKKLIGTNSGKAKLSMTGSEFRLRIDITMPSLVVSQIAVGSFLYSMRSIHERIIYEAFEDEKDAKLLEACKQWIHPELEASDKDIVVSFKI